jgi:hypothetical protein
VGFVTRPNFARIALTRAIASAPVDTSSCTRSVQAISLPPIRERFVVDDEA